MMLISSKVLAYTPLIKPSIENNVEVIKIENKVNGRFTISNDVKNKLTATTTRPTNTPLAMPPTIKPRSIDQFGIGDIKISSIAFWNFAPKNAEATLAYELVTVSYTHLTLPTN